MHFMQFYLLESLNQSIDNIQQIKKDEQTASVFKETTGTAQ